MKRRFLCSCTFLALLTPAMHAQLSADEIDSQELILPQVSSSNKDGSFFRKEYPTLESIIAYQDSLVNSRIAGFQTRSSRDLSQYAVGSIPIQESVSPSGARIYNIPIATAQGWNLTPSISLVYNSQSGNNVAGYGWVIGGLSSITVRNANPYYDNLNEGGIYDSATAKYALDGIPLVTSEKDVTDYTLETARGNILVRKYSFPSGAAQYFTALYPDGMTARFGFPWNLYPQDSYPLSILTDKDGNTISFYYSLEGNAYYVSSISYGSNASIAFSYTARPDSAAFGRSVFGHANDYPRKRLAVITSRNGGEVICEYGLTHQLQDGVSLLREVSCRIAGEELPPLVFSYGIEGGIGGGGNPTFEHLSTERFSKCYIKSDDLKVEYHRGKLIPCNHNDGIIILPQKSHYARVDSTWILGWKFKYGSKYAANEEFLCNFSGSSQSVQRIITAEAGFQLIEAVDIDGDGTDEIVKINSSVPSQDVTLYTITIYSFDSSFNYTSRSFNVRINDGWHNIKYDNPAKSFFRFGDFRGDGRTMLLIMTKHHSKFALVDLNTGTLLSETNPFTIGDYEDNPIIVADFENDGKADLCHVTETGMDVYSLTGTSSTAFSLRATYSGISQHQLYVEPNYVINGVPQEVVPKIYLVDLNGDGYQDIAAAPQLSVTIGGDIFDQTNTWNIARFDGKQFSTTTESLYVRTKDDTIIFLDVDKDGLPDMLHLQNSRLYYIPNINGRFTSQHNYANVSLDSSSDIVTGDCSLFGISGDIVVVSGQWVSLYGFSLDHALRRHLILATDSYGNSHTNTYYRTIGSAAYQVDPDRAYTSGFSRLRAPLYVLFREFNYDSSFHTYTNQFYTYWDAIYHTRGLGFCGFGKVRTMDYISGDESITVLDPEKFGVPISKTVAKDEAILPFSSVTNTYDSHTTTYGKLNPRLTQSVATDSLSGITTTTTYTYGDYDLPTTVLTSRRIGSGDEQTQRVTMTYSNSVSPTKYILGSVANKSVFTESDGDATYSWEERIVNTYDSNYHLLSSAQYVGKNGSDLPPFNPPFPDTLLLRIPPGFVYADHLVSRTCWTYDSHGNVTSEKIAPYNATTFTGDTLVYDASGRYLLSKTDALGHTTTYSNYNKFGKPATVTDYRNRTTSYTYDSWGNLTQVSRPDGGVEQTAIAWGGDGLYTVTQTATGSPETITHYDALGREIKSGVKRFNGQWQFTNKEYDSKGRLSRVSLPYRGSAPSYWNTYHYDAHDRPDSLCEASGRKTYWSYSGTSTTTIKDGIPITQTTDAMGRVVSTSDGGGTISYVLRDDGQPSSITVPGNVITTFTYDAYGRRTQMVDPSLGTESDSYTWNTDGSSVFTHTNRNGTVATSRDRFGRVTYVSRQGEFNTTYTYDTYGRLSAVSSTNSTGKEYTYDSYDRIATFKETAPENKWLQKTYTYAAGSVLSSIAYASQNGAITTETYTYSNGHNTGITLPGNKTVWSLVSENDLGQPTGITTGQQSREYGFTAYGLPTYRRIEDGYIQGFTYQFDPATGNLLSSNGVQYTYDALNRLIGITRGNTTRQIVYQDNGNITSIDGVGTLIYGGGAGVSPYEVTGLTPESGQPPYRQRAVTYNSFDRPATIAEGAYSAGMVYNADGDRVKMYVADTLSGPFVIRYYIGGRYEYDLFSGTERLYLGGDAYSAPMVYQRSGYGPWTLYNIGRDYQGSITSISDESDGIIAMYRYDPWGRLVDYSGVPYTPGNEPALFLGRGYTGHEYLPWFGLINANARLYDPLLGRFLSPDPYIQDSGFTQNYNRYSYCLNNPLKYTDESGEIITWNIGSNGISLGVNFGLFGFGINLGWGNGCSFGIYGELGPRLGGNGLGYGATVGQSLDYNLTYQHLTTTSSASCYASFACFTASASASYSYDIGYKTGAVGWSVGAGLGFGDSIFNWGPYVGYGSSGLIYGVAGFYDRKSSSRLENGLQYAGLNSNDPVPVTDDYLMQMQKLWYPDAPMDHIVAFSVENVPASVLESMNAKNANAQTALQYFKRTGELTGKFSVYYSERAFKSARQLYITMGHEFVHVSNYISAYCLGYNFDQVKQGTPFYELSEHWAYSFEAPYTGSTVSATNWSLIYSCFSPNFVDLFSLRHMTWFHSKTY